jgi:hypothetical protein
MPFAKFFLGNYRANYSIGQERTFVLKPAGSGEASGVLQTALNRFFSKTMTARIFLFLLNGFGFIPCENDFTPSLCFLKQSFA